MRVLICSILLAAQFVSPARAVEDYDYCLLLVETNPEQAQREAGDWARYGGGAPARHCYALALIAIGAPSRGIDELLGIVAEEPDLEPDARADILAQAGEMLLEEGDLVTATLVSEQAIRLDQRSAAALALRARLKLDAGELRAAVRDLGAALQQRPSSARFLALRASAHRRLGQLIEARDDAAFATEAAPKDPAAWLERGRVEAALKDRNAARYSFLQAIGLDREGEIGSAARLALQRMEAGIEE